MSPDPEKTGDTFATRHMTASSGSSSDAPFEEHEDEAHEERELGTSRPGLTRIKSYASGAEGYVGERGVLTRQKTGATMTSVLTNGMHPDYEVDWEEDDKGNPKQWPVLRKCLTIATMSYGTTTVVLYSTAFTSDLPGLVADFGISQTTGILGVTTYMLGVASGSLILAPLSEMYGRRPVYIIALSCFVLFCMASALAKNIETILVTRFFGAFCGSALISNAPGTVNDIVVEKYRALAFSLWSLGPMCGPVWGPLVGGFTYQYLGWRWTNWMVMILSGAALCFVNLIPETYAPILLKNRAARLRKTENEPRYWTRYDETGSSFLSLLKLNLSRPLKFLVTEPICIFFDVFIAIVYGILYLCFVAYPIVFSELRGWSPSLSGLSFMGIGVGSIIAILAEPLIRRIIESHKRDPETGEVPPEAMMSVVVAGAVLLAVGQLWFAWSCYPISIPWIVSIVAGIPFGMGNTLVFIYASNYLVHSYGIFSASALAGNALLRSLLGATVPLAGPAMYAKLGANWAGCLAGLLEVACIPIPLVFYIWGHKLREKSPLIGRMREEERRLVKRLERREAKRASVVTGGHSSEGEGGMKGGEGEMGFGEKSAVQEVRDVERGIEKRAEAEALTGAPMLAGAAVDEAAVDRAGLTKELGGR